MGTSRKHSRTWLNFACGTMDLGLFIFYLSLTSSATVLPLLIDRLTGSTVWIGIVTTVNSMGWYLPQIFSVPYINRLRKKKPLVLWTTASERLPVLVLGLIFLLWPALPPRTLLWIVLSAFLWQGLSGGLGGTAWQEMVAKSIPHRLWGTFFGVGNALGGVLSIAGGGLLSYLLSHYPFPTNFAYIFLAGAAVLFVGYWGLVAISEPEEEVKAPAPSVGQFLKTLPGFLRTRANFSAFLIGRSLGIMGSMGVNFYAIYALQRYRIPDSTIGIYTSVLAATQALFNPALGYLGDRYGHKPVLLFAILTEGASALLALFSPTPALYYLVYFFLGLAYTGFTVAGLSLPLEFGRSGDRTAFVALTNTVSGLFFGIAPLVGGLIAKTAGYETLFFLSVVFAVSGFLFIQGRMDNPR